VYRSVSPGKGNVAEDTVIWAERSRLLPIIQVNRSNFFIVW
jgi:hypothetical protein